MTIRLTYRGGVFVPDAPVQDVPEGATVTLDLTPAQTASVSGKASLPPGHPLAGMVGIISDEMAEEMLAVIDAEFERIEDEPHHRA